MNEYSQNSLIEGTSKTDVRCQARFVIALAAIPPTLAVCCGCPPAPPSQEEQRQAIPSCWICAEPAEQDSDANSSDKGLQRRDVDAIKATVPTVVTLVAERVGRGTAVREEAEMEVRLSGTGPDHFQLLADATKAEVIRGRFLTAADVETGADVIVIDEDPRDPTTSTKGQTSFSR